MQHIWYNIYVRWRYLYLCINKILNQKNWRPLYLKKNCALFQQLIVWMIFLVSYVICGSVIRCELSSIITHHLPSGLKKTNIKFITICLKMLFNVHFDPLCYGKQIATPDVPRAEGNDEASKSLESRCYDERRCRIHRIAPSSTTIKCWSSITLSNWT